MVADFDGIRREKWFYDNEREAGFESSRQSERVSVLGGHSRLVPNEERAEAAEFIAERRGRAATHGE